MLLFASCVQAIGRLLEPQFVPWTELMAFDPELGWRPRPDLDAHYLAQTGMTCSAWSPTGTAGRGHGSLDESAVVVIGDSFAFGYGVDAGKSFADLNPRLTIKADRGARLQHGAERALDGAVCRAARRQAGRVVRLPGERSPGQPGAGDGRLSVAVRPAVPLGVADGRSLTSISSRRRGGPRIGTGSGSCRSSVCRARSPTGPMPPAITSSAGRRRPARRLGAHLVLVTIPGSESVDRRRAGEAGRS